MGVESLRVLRFADTRFEETALLACVHEIERSLMAHHPAIVMTHHGGDLSMDHRWVHQATVAACRPKPGSSVRELLFYEVPSSTEWAFGAFEPFRPSVFVSLDARASSLKMEVLREAYGVEMREDGHPRSLGAVQALMTLRGAQCGSPTAEAFMPGRVIR